MIIWIEWGKKSVAYERLRNIGAVGVSVCELLIESDRAAVSMPNCGGLRPIGERR